MRKLHFSALFVFALLSTRTSTAAPVGAIKGYVRDSSGGVVSNANLTLTDENTRVEKKTTTNNTGLYQLLDLNPGTYSLVAEAPGFAKKQTGQITVLVGQIVSIDLELSIGNVTQTVDVSSGAELLQTEKASTGTNITSEQVGTLPLVNRRFNDLAILTPGTSFAAPGSQAGAFAAAGTPATSTSAPVTPRLSVVRNSLRFMLVDFSTFLDCFCPTWLTSQTS